jgi:S-formylglutathione hydrolase
VQAACDEAGEHVTLRYHEGYDHTYYFIQSFVESHVQHHAKALGATP